MNLRLLVVKRLYGWSYEETEARVADSFVLRWFCRVYWQRVPDDTPLIRWSGLITAPTLHAVNDRVARMAQQARVTQGRKLRLDGTVVRTAIHHPTDSSLLVDGVRVLSRLPRRSKPLVGDRLASVRDTFRTRLRTMRQGLQTLPRLARQQGEEAAEARKEVYRKLIATAGQTLRQVSRVRKGLEETEQAPRGRGQRLQQQFEPFAPLGGQVIHQARTRVLEGGKVPAEQKVVSLFAPHTRIIPRHKGGAAVEFGRTVVVDEVEGGIVTRYHILEDGATAHGELAPALTHHQAVFGHPPRLVAADRGLHHADNAGMASEAGVIHLVIPAWGRGTPAQRARQRTRAWRRRYRWRAGIEGRINSLRRDYGLKRCADPGAAGLERRVGWGMLASNLRHIGQHLAA